MIDSILAALRIGFPVDLLIKGTLVLATAGALFASLTATDADAAP